jgi:hypothetical protein
MRRIRSVGALVLVALAGLALAATGAQAKVENPGFESGDFSHWKTKTTPIAGGGMTRHWRGMLPSETEWLLYTEQTRKIAGTGIKLPSPRGTFSPVISQVGPGHNVLYRKIEVPKKAKMLKLQAYWHNGGDTFSFAGSFLDPVPGDQYFSVDLLKAKANPESTKAGDVLETLLAPEIPETGLVSDWIKLGVGLKPYRGDKVILRLAEVDTQSFNFVGIDKLKVTKKK